MIRRVADALLLGVAVVYGHHFAVAGARYMQSKRGLGSAESLEEAWHRPRT